MLPLHHLLTLPPVLPVRFPVAPAPHRRISSSPLPPRSHGHLKSSGSCAGLLPRGSPLLWQLLNTSQHRSYATGASETKDKVKEEEAEGAGAGEGKKLKEQTEASRPETVATEEKLEPIPKSDENAYTEIASAEVPEEVKEEKPLKPLSPYRTVEDPRRLIEDLEKDLVFPVKIVGSRKPNTSRFWAWDLNISKVFFDTRNPYLYLTFEDVNGKQLGPVRYNSRLYGRGLRPEVALRLQFGGFKGLQDFEFNSIPKRLDVEGFDGGFSAGFLSSLNYSRLKIAETDNNKEIGLVPEKDQTVKITYWGIAFPTAFGYMKVKEGYFEAEPYVTSIGVHPILERVLTFILVCVLVFGFIAATIPLVGLLGYGEIFQQVF
eukprot:TRINITY_DN3447_c0_g1_i1.p1 TRINITY_DN3447_c0_g1~~TRINITY_DN3447_c0_g1_i1.p1  ORF type:complete len:376 (-),score=83.65 TRINITY_DN3447_c0_g1_i1:220-1347(-)